jgi:hypothetical protein
LGSNLNHSSEPCNYLEGLVGITRWIEAKNSLGMQLSLEKSKFHSFIPLITEKVNVKTGNLQHAQAKAAFEIMSQTKLVK